jgi:sugar-specific transcriptional regulator TrmB
MDKTVLKQAGLNNNEIEVYLCLIRLGSITVSRISQETNLHRSNLYDTIEKLQNKGLVSHIIKNNIKYYQAAPPTRILEYLKEKLNIVSSIIPDLTKLSELPKEKTIVELYKGKEGLKTVFKDIIKTTKEFYVFGEAEKIEEILPIYSKQFFRQIDEKNIKEKVIFKKQTKIKSKTKKGEYKFISEEYYVPTSFNIYNNKVALFIWSLPIYIILITNKEIADSYRKYFNVMWKLAE